MVDIYHAKRGAFTISLELQAQAIELIALKQIYEYCQATWEAKRTENQC